MENPDRLVKAVNLKNESKNKWYASDTAKAPAVRYAHQNTIRFERGPMLLAAVASQDIDETDRLIRDNADVNYSNADGLTPLHQACIDENFEMVKLLVDNGANINACDNEGWTSLHAAASRGIPLEIVRYLVLKGGNIAAINADGELPLDLADNDQIAKYFEDELDKLGIDIDEAREVEEKLMLEDAERWKKTGKIDDIHDSQGATPLHIAAAKGYISVVKILLGLKADPNATDSEKWTPLHAAVYWKNEDVINELVKAGAKIFLQNEAGQTSFSLAEKEIRPLLQNLASKYNQKQEGDIIRKSVQPTTKKVTGILKTTKSDTLESQKVSSIPKPIQKPPLRNKDESIDSIKSIKSPEITKTPTNSAIPSPARPSATPISRPSKPPVNEKNEITDIKPLKESHTEISTPSKIPTPQTITSISKSTISSMSTTKPSSIAMPPKSTSTPISKPPTSTTSSVCKPPSSEISRPAISKPPTQARDLSLDSSGLPTEIRDLKTRILLLESEVSSLRKEKDDLLRTIEKMKLENDKNDSSKKYTNVTSSIARPPIKK